MLLLIKTVEVVDSMGLLPCDIMWIIHLTSGTKHPCKNKRSVMLDLNMPDFLHV